MLKDLIDKAVEEKMKEVSTYMRNAMLSTAQAKEVLYHLPAFDTLPDSTRISFGFGCLYVEMPRDKATMDEWEHALIQSGWTIKETDSSSSSGNIYWYCAHPAVASQYGSPLILSFDPHKGGATCHLNKIGVRTEMREIPIYEVVCDQALEENTWATE